MLEYWVLSVEDSLFVCSIVETVGLRPLQYEEAIGPVVQYEWCSLKQSSRISAFLML